MQTFFIVLIIIAALLLLCTGGYLFMIFPGRVNKGSNAWFGKTDFAHRGLYAADQSVPENSLKAFSQAVDAGFGIELDVELTSDDRLVVFHDDSLKRMTGEEDLLWDRTYAELQQLRLAGSEEKIPLFENVLKLVDGKVPLMVEIKSTKRLEKICSMTYALLSRYQGIYCMESFNPFMVAWFKKHASSVLRGQLSMRYRHENNLPWIRRFVMENLLLNFIAKPQFISYYHGDCGKLSFRLCRRFGALTSAWTTQNPESYARAKRVFDAVIFEHFLPAKG